MLRTIFQVQEHAGADLSATIGSLDMLGNTRSGSWDIGAYELGDATYFNVTPSVVGSVGGTISPAVAQSVASGATTTFTYTASNGWKFKVWAGTCGGTGTTTYTTSAITAACTVTVEFELIPPNISGGVMSGGSRR